MEQTIEAIRKEIERITLNYNIQLNRKIILNPTHENTKIIIVVSDDFKDVNTNKRPAPFYRDWRYKELPEPELICLTREEFKERKTRKPNIVNEAVETGIAV